MHEKERNTLLLEWYYENSRELPFRKNRIPYYIWISEIMAQQTRIEAMLPYFNHFIELYPNMEALAKADEADLMAAWAGLGYYSRMKNLHKTARICMEKYDGNLPNTKAELVKLPGIGDYTAGAIASICYGEKVSAIDGNVVRVFSRLCNLNKDFTKQKNKNMLKERVEADLPDDIASFNQALMELGALICIPKSPRCEICPLNRLCEAKKAGTQKLLPFKAAKKERKIENKIFYIPYFIEDDRIYISLEKREKDGVLKGWLGFKETNEPRSDFIYLARHKHVFSHIEWDMKVYLEKADCKDDSFYPLDEIGESIGIPSAFGWAIEKIESHIL